MPDLLVGFEFKVPRWECYRVRRYLVEKQQRGRPIRVFESRGLFWRTFTVLGYDLDIDIIREQLVERHER